MAGAFSDVRFTPRSRRQNGGPVSLLVTHNGHQALQLDCNCTLDMLMRLRGLRAGDLWAAAGAAGSESGPEYLVNRIESARAARRQLIDGMRALGAPEEELAPHRCARKALFLPTKMASLCGTGSGRYASPAPSTAKP